MMRGTPRRCTINFAILLAIGYPPYNTSLSSCPSAFPWTGFTNIDRSRKTIVRNRINQRVAELGWWWQHLCDTNVHILGGKTYSMYFEGLESHNVVCHYLVETKEWLFQCLCKWKCMLFDAKIKKERKEIYWLDIFTTYITAQYLSHEHLYKNYKNQ